MRIVMASSSTCVLFEHSLRQCAPYCVNLRQPWKGIAGPAASVDRAALDTHGDTVGSKSRSAAVSLRTLACYASDGPAAPTPIQIISGLPQGLAGRTAAGWGCRRLGARASQRR